VDISVILTVAIIYLDVEMSIYDKKEDVLYEILSN